MEENIRTAGIKELPNGIITLRVFGDRAIFTRPELQVERVTYEVMTPAAAKGILTSIYNPEGIVYNIHRIYVENPIQVQTVRTNEVKEVRSADEIVKYVQGKGDLPGFEIEQARTQRMNQILRNVSYIIEFRIDIDHHKAKPNDTVDKFIGIFVRYARTGKCHNQPCFGQRQFPAYFELCDRKKPYVCPEELLGERHLGMMFYGWKWRTKDCPTGEQFFMATLKDGILDVPAAGSDLLYS